MEETQTNKARRVCSFESNAAVYAAFSHKYVSYLLLALAKTANSHSSRHGTQDKKSENVMRFEVDMALVLAASGFKWSRALRNKLKHGNRRTALYQSPARHSTAESMGSVNKCNGIVQKVRLFRPPSVFPRPKSCNKVRGDDEFSQRMRTLRRILPGGSEMRVNELLSEVKSYMVCLQLQVNILRTLAEIH